jgi:hypothetical protein
LGSSLFYVGIARERSLDATAIRLIKFRSQQLAYGTTPDLVSRDREGLSERAIRVALAARSRMPESQ